MQQRLPAGGRWPSPPACDAEAYAALIEALDAKWRKQLGRVRANSAVEPLVDLLPGVRVITGVRATMATRTPRVKLLTTSNGCSSGSGHRRASPQQSNRR